MPELIFSFPFFNCIYFDINFLIFVFSVETYLSPVETHCMNVDYFIPDTENLTKQFSEEAMTRLRKCLFLFSRFSSRVTEERAMECVMRANDAAPPRVLWPQADDAQSQRTVDARNLSLARSEMATHYSVVTARRFSWIDWFKIRNNGLNFKSKN